jgi:hypothetical protein
MARRTKVHDETWRGSALEHLAADSSDPALQREFADVSRGEETSSRVFRKAWDRVFVFVFSGR